MVHNLLDEARFFARCLEKVCVRGGLLGGVGVLFGVCVGSNCTVVVVARALCCASWCTTCWTRCAPLSATPKRCGCGGGGDGGGGGGGGGSGSGDGDGGE
eukprot:145337-Chlamydomonas_euryale.AAC.2